MKTLRTILAVVALLMFATVLTTEAQTLQSRFLPNHNYSVLMKKTLSGNDGFQEVIPVTSTQRMHIVAGAVAGNGFPVTLTVYNTVQASRQNEESVQWEFSFDAMEDGTLTNAQIVSAAEPMEPSLAFAMLSRTLDPVLFQTAYTLQKRSKDVTKIVKQSPRDGAEDFVDIEYMVDKRLSETEQGESREPMATDDSGTATFHQGQQFFIERVLNEVNRIYVAEDANGEEKNVIMRKDVHITVDVEVQ